MTTITSSALSLPCRRLLIVERSSKFPLMLSRLSRMLSPRLSPNQRWANLMWDQRLSSSPRSKPNRKLNPKPSRYLRWRLVGAAVMLRVSLPQRRPPAATVDWSPALKWSRRMMAREMMRAAMAVAAMVAPFPKGLSNNSLIHATTTLTFFLHWMLIFYQCSTK